MAMFCGWRVSLKRDDEGTSSVRLLSLKHFLLALGLLMIALGVWRANLLFEQDRCLDSGGCWDHDRGACEYEEQLRCGERPSP